MLSGVAAVRTPFEPASSRAVYHLYVIRTNDRDALGEHLKSNGISTGLHYPVPVHLQHCYRGWGYRKGSLPITETIAAEILSLPMFPGLTPEQQATCDVRNRGICRSGCAAQPLVRVVTIVGARPQFIKAAAVSRVLTGTAPRDHGPYRPALRL